MNQPLFCLLAFVGARLGFYSTCMPCSPFYALAVDYL